MLTSTLYMSADSGIYFFHKLHEMSCSLRPVWVQFPCRLFAWSGSVRVLCAWLHHTGNRVEGGGYCDTPGFALLISAHNCCPFSMSPHTILLNCHIFPNDFPSSTEKSLFSPRKAPELETGWIQHAKGLAQLG